MPFFLAGNRAVSFWATSGFLGGKSHGHRSFYSERFPTGTARLMKYYDVVRDGDGPEVEGCKQVPNGHFGTLIQQRFRQVAQACRVVR